MIEYFPWKMQDQHQCHTKRDQNTFTLVTLCLFFLKLDYNINLEMPSNIERDYLLYLGISLITQKISI